jgi:Right handed beta helix region
VLVTLLVTLAFLSHAAAPTLSVAPSAGCSAAPARAQLLSGARACTITAAERVARPGDRVWVAPGAYPPTRIAASGTAAAPINVVAAGGVTIEGSNGGAALTISGVHDVAVRGIAVTGGAPQAVWINRSTRIGLVGVKVTAGYGHGIQVNSSTAITVAESKVLRNASAGIMETGADAHTLYQNDVVSGNGMGGSVYLGSGVQLAGRGARIVGCTITQNGTSNLYEHGVYVAASARGWRITGSTITRSSGSDVKAAGSAGVIATSSLGSARIGVYASGRSVTLKNDRIRGSFLDGVMVAGGDTLLSHTVVSNAANGWPRSATAAFVTGGRLTLSATTLLLRGVAVGPRRVG